MACDVHISEETEETDSRVSAHDGSGRANERDERDKLIAWLIAWFSWFKFIGSWLPINNIYLLQISPNCFWFLLRQILLLLSFLSRTSDAKICKVLKHAGQNDRSATKEPFQVGLSENRASENLVLLIIMFPRFCFAISWGIHSLRTDPSTVNVVGWLLVSPQVLPVHSHTISLYVRVTGLLPIKDNGDEYMVPLCQLPQLWTRNIHISNAVEDHGFILLFGITA